MNLFAMFVVAVIALIAVAIYQSETDLGSDHDFNSSDSLDGWGG